MSVQVERRLFSVAEYHKMIAAGVFGEDNRVELIAGEVVRMAAMGSRHAACVQRLTHWLVEHSGGRFRVRVQCPVELSELWEPEPDLALVRPRRDDYASGHPKAADVLLVIEVADTSSAHDRRLKARQYAHEGVPELWVIELERERIGVLRGPGPEGYRDIQWLRRGRRIAPLALPDLEIEVAAILG
jgi:Uma2 family endonuclease